MDGTKRKLSVIVLATLRALPGLPPVDALLKHPLAATVKNISKLTNVKDLSEAAKDVLKVWLRERNNLIGKPKASTKPVARKPGTVTSPPPAPKPVAAAQPSPARPRPVAAPAPAPAKKPIKAGPSKTVVRPGPATTSSFAATFLGASSLSTQTPPKPKKRRVIAPPPEKKRGIVSLDENGQKVEFKTQEKEEFVTEDPQEFILSADDLIARQKKQPRIGPAPVSKPVTAAQLVAKIKEAPSSDVEHDALMEDVDARVGGGLDEPKEVVPPSAETMDVAPTSSTSGPAVPEIVVASGSDEAPPQKKAKRKQVTWAPDDVLVVVKTFVPENPSQMLSTRSALKGVRQLSKLDLQHERRLKEQKTEELSAKELAKLMEPTVSWSRPMELKIDYEEDTEPPKRGEEVCAESMPCPYTASFSRFFLRFFFSFPVH